MEEQNIGGVEQTVRMVVGSLSTLLGIVLLIPGEASLASGVIGTILVIVGLYLFVSGSTAGWDGLPGGLREMKTGPGAMDGGDGVTIAVYRWAGSSGC